MNKTKTMTWGRISAAALLACTGGTQAAAPVAPAATATGQLDKVEIQGEAASDLRQRQDFVAGKIVVSRKAIEASGQATIYEVLKREPAVTVGADGRLGLLGLPGYTRILVDGKPPMPGRDPLEQDVVHVEHIEIVKGSMAEYGPFGIAGVINIVTRRLERKTSASLRTGMTLGPAAGDANLAWSNNIRPVDEPWSLANRVSVRHKETDVHQETATYGAGSASSAPLQDRAVGDGDDRLSTLMLGSTLGYQWSKTTDMDTSPLLMVWRTGADMDETHHWQQDDASSTTTARTTNGAKVLTLALPMNWRHRQADGSRLELQYESSRNYIDRNQDRTDVGTDDSQSTLRQTRRRDRLSIDGLRLQYSPKSPEDHALKLGARLNWRQQVVGIDSLVDGAPDTSLAAFGNRQTLSGPTGSAFVQDEWTISKRWAATAGLSVEGQRLDIAEGPLTGRASYGVLSPSLHVAHKLTEDGTRKLRLSIARSFNAPSTDQYLQRPTINPLAPCTLAAACGANTVAYADTAGNPSLRPERAVGITVSYEHYVGKDSMVGVDAFQRRLTDTIGELVSLETVSWASAQRYVIRPTNLGRAWTRGVSLESRLTLADFDATWPKLELRGGATLARSELSDVPGPDNRMAGQTPWSAKLGARYKLSSMPLELSADANWAPGLWYRSAVDHRLYQGRRQDVSLQASWTVSPALKWRLGAGNLLGTDQHRQDVYGSGDIADARVDAVKRTSPTMTVTLEIRL